MNKANSHRQILRSSSLIGSASLLNIGVSIIRTKALAVLLGPSGVGMAGLLVTLMTTVSGVAGLGMGAAGTRQIAEAAGKGDAAALAIARRALLGGALFLAVLGGLVVWLLRGIIASYMIMAPNLQREIGWLAVGVALTIAGGAQGALLNGLRRIGDMARLSVLSGVLSLLLGLGVLWLWGQQALIPFVLMAPLSSFLLGQFYISRLPKDAMPPTPLPVIMVQWRTLVKLGLAYMLTGVVWNCGHMLIRMQVQRAFGLAVLGQFQAAWSISMMYIGFVLQAMSADYYPRLAENIHDHSFINQMVNEQTEIALLLAGPVILAMLALSPWVIELLYTHQFAAAANVLRWQILGDILRIAAWPLSYVILAAGDGRTYLLVESLSVAVLVGGIGLGLSVLGIQAAGIAFLLMYVVTLPVVYRLINKRTGFCWTRSIFFIGTLLLSLSILCVGLASINAIAGMVMGCIAAGCYGLFALGRLSHMANLSGFLQRFASGYRRFATMIGERHG